MVALLDYGSGNVRSAQRAVERAGATVNVTRDPYEVLDADGLLVPGVGAFSACMKQLKEVNGDRMIGQRLAGGRPVLGICVGMQILFDAGVEFADHADHGSTPGMGEWRNGHQARCPHFAAHGVEHCAGGAGKCDVRRRTGTRALLFRAFLCGWDWELFTDGRTEAPKVHWAEHDGCRFVAAVENGYRYAISSREIRRCWVGLTPKLGEHAVKYP